MIRCTLLLLLLLLPLPRSAHAATQYYLSPTGSDSAVCSEAAPCKSFTTALPLLRPGDTLVLQPGTYAQRLLIGNPPVTSGTASQPVTLKGQPGALIQPPSGVEGATINGNTQYWTLEDLTFDCSKLASSTSTVNCMSINWRSGPMDSPQATSHITLRRVTLRNTSNPAGTNAIGLSIGAWHNTIADVTIDGTHLQPGDRQGSHGIYLSGSHNRLLGGKVTHAGGCGVQLNDSSHNPNGNRDNHVIGMWIEGNGNRTTGGGACGLTVYHNMQDTRVVGNVIVKNKGDAMLHEGGNNTGSVLVHNTIVGNQSHCLSGGHDSNHPSLATTFQNNICQGNGGGLRLGPYAGDAAVVANILSDQTPPESSAGDTAASGNLVGVDPQFVDASAGNYQPQATSPACQSGAPLPGLTRDRRGRGTGREPTRGALPCVGQVPVPPEPPQPGPGTVTLLYPAVTLPAMTCTGTPDRTGVLRLACAPDTARTETP